MSHVAAYQLFLGVIVPCAYPPVQAVYRVVEMEGKGARAREVFAAAGHGKGKSQAFVCDYAHL